MAELKFKHIAIGNDGTVWTVGKTDGTIYRLFGDAGIVGWVPDKIGKAEVIAPVNWGNLWCVNKEHEIWNLANAENIDTGGTWTQVPTYTGKADARTIAVGGDGSVWYTEMDGTIYHLVAGSTHAVGNGNGPQACFVPDDKGGKIAVRWEPDQIGKGVSITVDNSGNPWCVNKEHEIWYLETADNLGNSGAWTRVLTHSGKADARTISAGYDGVFYVQMDGTLIETTPPGVGVNMDYWRVNSGPGKVEVIAAQRQGGLWCLTRGGEVWHTVEGKWRKFVNGPVGNTWTYTVKSGDNLLAIVRKEFNLSDPEHTRRINQIVDRIVAQNRGITRDRIKIGDVLTLNN